MDDDENIDVFDVLFVELEAKLLFCPPALPGITVLVSFDIGVLNLKELVRLGLFVVVVVVVIVVVEVAVVGNAWVDDEFAPPGTAPD